MSQRRCEVRFVLSRTDGDFDLVFHSFVAGESVQVLGIRVVAVFVLVLSTLKLFILLILVVHFISGPQLFRLASQDLVFLTGF
ncbi:hypothetical protein K438DRAFT_1960453 [Mycena galopus ATCC 62051]|nr:hypothetical protein K438DRAFT_1960453 [Mycena galopus ATCC 62051]